MQRYLITIDLTEHLAEYVAGLQEKYQPGTERRLPPHITLIPPTEGTLTPEQLHQLRELHFSMDLHSIGWGSFDHEDGHTMFLVPQADGLLELWHQVTKIVGNGLHDKPTMPKFHMTVVKKVHPTEWAHLQATLVKVDPRGHCRVGHLTVYAWDELPGSWRILS